MKRQTAAQDGTALSRWRGPQPPSVAVRIIRREEWYGLGRFHLQPRELRLALYGADPNRPDPGKASTVMAALTSLRIVAAGLIGFVAWHGMLWAIPLSLIAPCLIAIQPTRLAAGGTSFA